MMNKDEAVQKLSKVARISVAYAEDLYDSFFEKPVVPQFVADWYEEHKDNLDFDLREYIINWYYKEPCDFKEWIDSNSKIEPLVTLANMHQFGYEVEKEPRYTVRIKGLSEINRYLNKECDKEFLFADSGESEDYQTKFTRKELEEGGFGEVFDNPMFEVKEVTDE